MYGNHAATAISHGTVSLHPLALSSAHITQAEGRDGTFQSQIGTCIKSVCPTLARLCGTSLDELQPGEFWGGRTEVQMRENSVGADLAQPRCNF